MPSHRTVVVAVQAAQNVSLASVIGERGPCSRNMWEESLLLFFSLSPFASLPWHCGSSHGAVLQQQWYNGFKTLSKTLFYWPEHQKKKKKKVLCELGQRGKEFPNSVYETAQVPGLILSCAYTGKTQSNTEKAMGTELLFNIPSLILTLKWHKQLGVNIGLEWLIRQTQNTAAKFEKKIYIGTTTHWRGWRTCNLNLMGSAGT